MSLDSPCGRLRLDMRDGVARLLIDNPERRNALDLAMWRALPGLLRSLDADPEARVVVLMGAPGLPFCSGADISEFSTVRATAEGGRAYEAANVAAFDALSGLSKPTLALISGFCLGGGLGLAAACDLRIAAQDAVFGVPAGKLGVGYPPSAMKYVVAAAGTQGAFDLFYTARRLPAAEAQAMGLTSRLLPVEGFAQAGERIARDIAANAPLTLKAAKAAIRAAAGLPGAPSRDECEALANACFDSADYAEGRAAFLEKRPPAFRGG